MDTVTIAGGTGLIGTALSRFLHSRGFSVIILTRHPKKYRSPSPGIRYAEWNIEKQKTSAEAFREANYLIHLAGAGVVDKPWTEKRKKEIRESRTKSSEFLIESIKNIDNKIISVVSASAIGWYISRPGPPSVETEPSDPGFLGETCHLWENSIQPVQDIGKKLVILRTGIVLSKEGGAFPEFARPVRYGLAPILGSGKQIISWIHIEDLCRLYMEAMINPDWSGIYNAVSPNPVNNRIFTIDLAKKMKGSFYIPIPVPNFVLRLMMGGRSEEVLKSSNISSEKIKQQGFQFIYPTIDAAFRELLVR